VLRGGLVFAIVLLWCGQSLSGELDGRPAGSVAEQLDALFRGEHEARRFNGVVLVKRGTQVIYQKAWGQRGPDGKQPLTLDSAFYLASLAKPFTAMAVMILEQDGKLSYSDKLTKFFPDFPAYGHSVTVHQLLSHTSGVANYYRLMKSVPDGLGNQRVFQLLRAQPRLDFEPGTAYAYSNGGYVLLAMIIEKISGESYAAFLKRRIFDPLGMKRSLVYEKSTPPIANRAVGMTPGLTADDYRLLTTGPGGVYSTVADLAKWDDALQNNKLVSAERLDRAFTPVRLNGGKNSNYGYGWSIQWLDGRRIVRHKGSRNGYRSSIRRDFEREETVIMLTNAGGPVIRGLQAMSVDKILATAHSASGG
jgi:CubicO group peptidase (beta-lactamase class C family)